MPKYAKITAHLLRMARLPRGEYRMTFADIENVLGEPLPPSAYRHRPWWSNSRASLMAHSWLEAGWKTAQVDMEGRKLVFKRIQQTPPRDAGLSDRPQTPLEPGPHSLTVPGIDAPTLSRLKAKAELHGRSIEDMARHILERGVILTPAERLALADRTRAKSPALHDIDMVAMIREDREER